MLQSEVIFCNSCRETCGGLLIQHRSELRVVDAYTRKRIKDYTDAPTSASVVWRSKRFQAVGTPISLRHSPPTRTSLPSELENSTRASKVSEYLSVVSGG
jgi:hypothetical protein